MFFSLLSLFIFIFAFFSTQARPVAAFDNQRRDNVAVYWGQNSYGASHSGTTNWQNTLADYCQDSSIDVIPIAFLNVFFGPSGFPTINLANSCHGPAFAGTSLSNCAHLADDIAQCQSRGKMVTLSLGGATGSVGFSSQAQAEKFALTIWNLFLGGTSATRPFGNAVLDGVDLDIEGGTSTSYAAFLNKLRSLATNAGTKQPIVTAAPQCVFPDAALGEVLNTAFFDHIYVQFYNNPCGLNAYPSSEWNFGVWDVWARTTSLNKDVKVYIAAPASSTAAGSGYQDISSLLAIAKKMRNTFPSFGGIALWDASQAYANNRYDNAVKTGLIAMGEGFTFPTCTAPAWSPSNGYPGGSKVVYQGYLWQAKWYVSSKPSNDLSSGWNPTSACDASSSPSVSATASRTISSSISSFAPSTAISTLASLSSTTVPSSVTVISSSISPSFSSIPPSSVTRTSTVSVPTASSCGSVSAWTRNGVYTAGKRVAYNGQIYKARWWTQGDEPSATSDVWAVDGGCTTSTVSNAANPSPTLVSDCSSVPAWSRSSVYDSGKQVTYNDGKWKALWWVQGETPEETNPAWDYLGSCAAPAHGFYIATPSLTAMPSSSSSVYKCRDFATWSGAIVYTAGKKVVFRDRIFRAKWSVKSDEQPDTADVWEDEGTCMISIKRRHSRRKHN